MAMTTHQLRAKQHCTTPLHFHVLMVNLPDTTEQVTSASDPEGLAFTATYINSRTGEQVREIEIHLQPDVRVYFIASQHPHWYFILQFSAFYSRFGCSCLAGKQFNQTRQECEHMRQIEKVVA